MRNITQEVGSLVPRRLGGGGGGGGEGRGGEKGMPGLHCSRMRVIMVQILKWSRLGTRFVLCKLVCAAYALQALL